MSVDDYGLRTLRYFAFFFFNDTATTEIYTLSLHDALPISLQLFARPAHLDPRLRGARAVRRAGHQGAGGRHSADSARRHGAAYEPGAGGDRPDRGAARLVVGAVRQRDGRRDQHLD